MSLPFEVTPGDLRVGTSVLESDDFLYNNISLRVGEVIRAIFPNEERSLTKHFMEYDVLVRHKDGETAHTRVYQNCMLINEFGGLADKTIYSLRVSTKVNDSKLVSFGDGSRVLVLCVNGLQNSALIVGGIRVASDDFEKKHDVKSLGHYYYSIFNGVELSINKYGELSVTQKGPTKADGTFDSQDVKEESTGTNINILKNGNFEVKTKKDAQFFKLDHENSKVLMQADKSWEVSVKNGKSYIKSQGLQVGDATDKMMLGSTYRDAESQLFKNIQTAFVNMFALTTSIGVSLQASTDPGALAAAPMFSQLAQQMQKISQELAKFEAQSTKYLSAKNKND